jgi:hypothetical protein
MPRCFSEKTERFLVRLKRADQQAAIGFRVQLPTRRASGVHALVASLSNPPPTSLTRYGGKLPAKSSFVGELVEC